MVSKVMSLDLEEHDITSFAVYPGYVSGVTGHTKDV
jgi:hypothetical protein